MEFRDEVVTHSDSFPNTAIESDHPVLSNIKLDRFSFQVSVFQNSQIFLELKYLEPRTLLIFGSVAASPAVLEMVLCCLVVI